MGAYVVMLGVSLLGVPTIVSPLLPQPLAAPGTAVPTPTPSSTPQPVPPPGDVQADGTTIVVPDGCGDAGDASHGCRCGARGRSDGGGRRCRAGQPSAEEDRGDGAGRPRTGHRPGQATAPDRPPPPAGDRARPDRPADPARASVTSSLRTRRRQRGGARTVRTRAHWVVLGAVLLALGVALLVQGYTHHFSQISDDSAADLRIVGETCRAAVSGGGPIVDASQDVVRSAAPAGKASR